MKENNENYSEAHPDMTGMQYGPLAYNAPELEDPEKEEKLKKRLWLRIEIHKATTVYLQERDQFEYVFDKIYACSTSDWESHISKLRDLVKFAGNGLDDFKEIIHWVFDSPTIEWEGKFYCLSYEYGNEHLSGLDTLNSAKKLFDRLK